MQRGRRHDNPHGHGQQVPDLMVEYCHDSGCDRDLGVRQEGDHQELVAFCARQWSAMTAFTGLSQHRSCQRDLIGRERGVLNRFVVARRLAELL